MAKKQTPAAKRKQEELAVHKTVLEYLRLALPKALIHHSPNEFGMSGFAVMRLVQKAKSMGMVKGWPDLEILHQGQVYFMEIKAGNGRLSPDQKDVLSALANRGFPCEIVRSVDDAKRVLGEWGLVFNSNENKEKIND